MSRDALRITALLLVSNVCCVWAQQTRIQHLSIQEGLSSSYVTCLLQDRRGFVWIGTEDGLTRYDGHSCKVFSTVPNNDPGLGNAMITAMYEDKKGALWVATNQGLNRYVQEADSFINYSFYADDAIKTGISTVYSMCEDSAGNFWISSWNGGLYAMDRDKGTFTLYQPYPDSVYWNSYRNTAVIFHDPIQKHRLWVPFGINGRWQMYAFDTRTRTFELFNSDGLPFLGYISDMAMDADGIIWIATNKGLWPFDPVAGRFLSKDKLSSTFKNYCEKPASSLMIDEKGHFWVCLRNEDVVVLDKTAGLLERYFQPEGAAESPRIYKTICLFKGQAGEIWVGTADQGVYIVQKALQRFRYLSLKELVDNSFRSLISAIHEDSRGNIWIGFSDGGLYLFNPSENRLEKAEDRYPFLRALSGYYVFSICELEDGQLWVGTNGYGLIRADLTQKTIQKYSSVPGDTTSLCSDYIGSLKKDRKGRLWIGTFAGLNVYDPSREGFRRYVYEESNAAGLPGSYVRCLYEDRNGYIWAGTDNGFCVLNPANDRLRSFFGVAPGAAGRSGPGVISILQDSTGVFWVGTNWGLSYLRFPDAKNPFRGEPQTRFYTEADGMPQTEVRGLLADNKGRLWISTLNGLSLFRNPHHDKHTTPDFRNFGSADGTFPIWYGNRTSCALRSGLFVFSGRNDLLMFLPGQITDDPYRPSVVITFLEKYNSELPEAPPVAVSGISYQPEVELQHTNNIFTIGFTALDFISNGTNQFAYRMKGFNDSWVPVGRQRKVTFTNLDPGTYLFEVRGTNRDGIWSDQTASLKIVIRPPWWKSWWAYALYGLLILGAIGLFVRIRLRFLRQQTRQLEKAVHIGTEKIRNQKEQLEQQARELQELDRLKSRFYTNITHELRTPLTLILGPLESLIKNNRLDGKEAELLKMARRNGQKLGKMIQSILDLSKLEAGKLELRETPVALSPLLRQMASQFDSFAVYLGIQLRFQTDLPDNLSVMLDAPKMETILNNLISNALKFTEKGGRVDVSLAASDNTLLLTVRDTGRGIHPEDLPHVFDRFYQTRRREIPEEGGTGIGLALSAELMKLLGGRIWAESEPGRGSAFFLEWPKRLPPPGTPETSPRSVSPPAAAFEAPKPVVESRTDAPKILIVEDNPDLQTYLMQLLAPLYDLTLANNGEEALEALEGVDLIISDVLMPRMDGFQLLDRLKADDRYRGIPVIMLTARADIQDKLRALRTGVDDYLTKPFDEEELLARVRNLLAGKSNRQETNATETAANRISEADSEWLAALEAWTKANLPNEHLSVSIMARQFALSERQLLRRMRELTGLSPQQYIGELRLQKAREALERGAYRTVAEAAYAAGFRNAKAFARAYKERFGRLPSSYF